MTSCSALASRSVSSLAFLLLLLAVEYFFKGVLRNVEHDRAEHLNQPAIGVVSEARIVAALGQALDRLVVQAKVEDGVHHAGHRKLCARANTHEQRIVCSAQLLALQCFQPAKRFIHLMIDFLRDGIVSHVLAASLGLDGKAGRHGKSGVGHLGQSGAFAAQFVLHLAVTFGVSVAEEVNVFDGSGVGGCARFDFSCMSAHRVSFAVDTSLWLPVQFFIMNCLYERPVLARGICFLVELHKEQSPRAEARS